MNGLMIFHEAVDVAKLVVTVATPGEPRLENAS